MVLTDKEKLTKPLFGLTSILLLLFFAACSSNYEKISTTNINTTEMKFADATKLRFVAK